MSKQALIDVIRRLGVMKGGPFKLASGGTSDIIIDLSKALRTAEGQDALANRIREVFPEDVEVVGGPICGSDLVAFAIVNAGKAKRWFGVRKEPKNRGKDRGVITGNLHPGEKVWIVEDVCTTGSNLVRAVNVAQEDGANVAGLFSVVERGGLEKAGKELGLQTLYLVHLDELR